MEPSERIEDLHQRAASQYLQGEFVDARELWRELLEIDPHDERAIEGVRLCELLSGQAGPAAAEAGSLTLALEDEAVAPRDAIELGDLPDLKPDDGEALEALGGAHSAGAQAAAEELGRRVRELLSEATKAWDCGDSETATSLVQRIFILDEHNADARRLSEAIELEAGAHQARRQVPETGSSEAVGAGGVELGFELPIDVEPTLIDGFTDSSTPPPTPTHRAPAMIESEPPAAADEPAATEAETIEPEPPAMARPRRRGGWWLACALLVTVGAGGWLGWTYLRPSGGEASAPPAPVESSARAKGKAARKPKATPPPTAPATPAPGETPAALLERARAMSARGDHAAAIIACSRALELEPKHAAATAMLQREGELYREQRKNDGQLAEARTLFHAGDYAGALRMIYRFPGTEKEPRFDRYKANGWYNLALRELGTGNCRQAGEHLGEARALVPDDPGARVLEELVRTCGRGPADPRFQAAVAATPFRSLDEGV